MISILEYNLTLDFCRYIIVAFRVRLLRVGIVVSIVGLFLLIAGSRGPIVDALVVLYSLAFPRILR